MSCDTERNFPVFPVKGNLKPMGNKILEWGRTSQTVWLGHDHGASWGRMSLWHQGACGQERESRDCGRRAASRRVRGLSLPRGCSPKAGRGESSGCVEKAEQALDVLFCLQW